MAVGEKQSSSGNAMRVLITLVIWLALALAAEVVIAAVSNVRPCVRSGVTGCLGAFWNGIGLEPPQAAAEPGGQPPPAPTQRARRPRRDAKEDLRNAWAKPNVMDWVILVVSLIVAVRIMYPPEDLSAPPPKPADASKHP